MFDWTEERIKMITELWLDGWTSTAIAQKLHVSRRAVSGKLNRLGLYGHRPCQGTALFLGRAGAEYRTLFVAPAINVGVKRLGVRLVSEGALQTALCPLSNRSLHRRNGNWKTASRDRRPKPAPHGPKYRKLPTRDWGTPA